LNHLYYDLDRIYLKNKKNLCKYMYIIGFPIHLHFLYPKNTTNILNAAVFCVKDRLYCVDSDLDTIPLKMGYIKYAHISCFFWGHN